MKTIVFSALLSLSTMVSAQIFITSAHFIDVSDVVQIGIDTNPSITHTPAGPNQTWDYGELNDYETDFVALGMAEWFSGASNFPDATLGTQDETGIQIFFRKNTEAFDLMGIYGELFEEGEQSALGFSPYQRQLTFPSTYGTTFTNVSTINLTIEDFEGLDSIVVTVVTHRFSEMDAWGSLSTPFGTFDAIRQHVKDSTIQSFTAYLFGFPVGSESETFVSHNYSFYSDAQNARYILLQYNYDPEFDILENVQWQMAAPILNNENNLNDLQATIYPNPANHQVNVKFEQSFSGELIVLDISGQIIFQKQYENLMHDFVDVNNWTAGVYIFQFKSENIIQLKKVVIH